MPDPSKKFVRTLRPEPLGATSATSTCGGGITPVSSLKVMEKPCEKYSISPSLRHSTILDHWERWPESDNKYWIPVPFSAASSTDNKVCPGTQPSSSALFQFFVPARWPTMTFTP